MSGIDGGLFAARDERSDTVAGAASARRSAAARILAFVISVALGLSAVWWLFAGEQQDFAAAGLGVNTTVHDESLRYGGRRVVCSSLADLGQCLSALPPPNGRKRVLWLGWSQLYAINDYHAGDRTAPSLVAERLDREGVDLIAVAMPNVNPREELLVYEYVRRRLAPSALIVPAWLQGMKQEGIRPTWQAALADRETRAALASLPSGSSILAAAAAEEKSAQEIGQQQRPAQEQAQTTQARVEGWLTARLGELFPLWRVRGDAQGRINLELASGKEQLLRLRNLLLGTRAKRWINVIPPARQAINMQALTDLVGAARHDGLSVLVYVPPRPSGAAFPFDAAVYAAFKADCERLARSSGASFANIEDSVSDAVWGTIDNGAGELVTDYSHFTAVGHRQMANAMEDALATTILPARPMIFNSFTYIFFLAGVTVIYWLLPRRPRHLFLFAASIAFYGFWRFDYVFIMLASAFTDFFAAINIHAAKEPMRRRLWLAVSLAVNFGLLFYFKYATFIVGNINGLAHLIGRDDLLETWSVVLPVGISFYTFQTVSYTVDVYRGRIDPIRDPLLYGLFVTYFVHLVAGPILRAVEVIPQLDRRKPFELEFLASGLWLILNGLFLKCVLADNIAGYVDEGFAANPATLSPTDVWVLATLFGFQIYFDFAAYSQIAIGSARLMGVIFPPNFYFPYVATSPRDFWRRWHISLSSWIRDYLYLPLCGVRPHDESRGGLVPVGDQVPAGRRNAALVATWFIMGLWHGAGWTFALWGLWHAMLILVQRAIAGLGLLRRHARLRGALGWAVTFPAVMLGWVFFRAQNLGQAWAMTHQVLQPGKYLLLDRLQSGYLWSVLPIEINPVSYLLAAILPIATLVAYYVYRDVWPRWSQRWVVALPVAVAYGTVVAAFVFVYLRPVRQFIYFQF